MAPGVRSRDRPAASPDRGAGSRPSRTGGSPGEGRRPPMGLPGRRGAPAPASHGRELLPCCWVDSSARGPGCSGCRAAREVQVGGAKSARYAVPCTLASAVAHRVIGRRLVHQMAGIRRARASSRSPDGYLRMSWPGQRTALFRPPLANGAREEATASSACCVTAQCFPRPAWREYHHARTEEEPAPQQSPTGARGRISSREMRGPHATKSARGPKGIFSGPGGSRRRRRRRQG